MSQGKARAARKAEEREHRYDIPVPERSLAAIKDMIAIWPSPNQVTVPILDGHWMRAALIYIQADHAVAMARAVLLLDEHKMHLQSVPSARLVYECGASAAWLVRTPHSGHAMYSKSLHQQELMVKGFNHMALTTGQTPIDIPDVKGWKQYEPLMKPIEQRCKAIDNGEWMYTYYRMLSQYSHGDAGLLAGHMQIGEDHPDYDHPFRLVGAEDEFDRRDVVIALTAVALSIALQCWDKVDRKHELHDRIAKIMRKYGLTSKPFNENEPIPQAAPVE